MQNYNNIFFTVHFTKNTPSSPSPITKMCASKLHFYDQLYHGVLLLSYTVLGYVDIKKIVPSVLQSSIKRFLFSLMLQLPIGLF